MKRALFSVLVLLLFCLGGCGTKYSTLLTDPANPQKYGFAAPKTELLEEARTALAKVVPGQSITPFQQGQNFGLSATSHLLLDFYTHHVLFIPVRGTDKDGNESDAYAFEVYGSGTYPGGSKDAAITNALLHSLESKYPKVIVK